MPAPRSSLRVRVRHLQRQKTTEDVVDRSQEQVQNALDVTDEAGQLGCDDAAGGQGVDDLECEGGDGGDESASSVQDGLDLRLQGAEDILGRVSDAMG